MKRLLAVLVLAGASVNGQMIGVQTGIFIYKNNYNPSSQILSSSEISTIKFQHGIWNDDTGLFMPFAPEVFNIDPFSLGGELGGEFGVVFDVHPDRPTAPASPLPASQRLGFQITYTDNAGNLPVFFSAVIVFGAWHSFYFGVSDEAKIGQIHPHPESGVASEAEGIAYVLVPEPSSLSLLLAGGAGALAWSKKRPKTKL